VALANHLQRVKYIVPAERVAELQKLRIWLELDGELGNMQYHPDKGWLKANGHHAWSKESFHPRFRSHVETRSHGVEERRTNKPSGLSHAPAVAWNDVPQQPQVYVGVRFLGRGELRENTEENTELADLADLQGRCLEKDYLENHPQGSARSASDGLPGAHRGGAIDGRF